MHRDLNAILDGLRTLDQRGVQSLDCRGAELSADEPVGRLRMICQSWKAMFQAEYSYGQPLRMLTDLRVAVDAALSNRGEEGDRSSTPSGAAVDTSAVESSAEKKASANPASDDAKAGNRANSKGKRRRRAMAAAASGESALESGNSGTSQDQSGSEENSDQ
jgi:hypothetical protein